MRSVDLIVESELRPTPRIKQLSGMFDVPARDKLRHHWQGAISIDERPWQIGLLIGPSGSGKSTLLRSLFGEPVSLQWNAGSVIDDFGSSYSIDDIASICQAVGFNTIPSWMKPFGVLSTGERFRVEMARQLLEGDKLIALDEFTSVIDRQVAKIGAHAVQKYIRRHADRQFVAATCHYDVIEWLQPDWMLEPATMTFQWRSVQRRPALNVEISRVDYAAWKLFAPFHYLTADLHKAAACYVLFVEGMPASFGGVLHRPHPKVDDVKGLSRLVTLPGANAPAVMQAILSVMPLDDFKPHPAAIMQVVGDPAMVPEAEREFAAVLARNDLPSPARLERRAFYHAAAEAFAIVATGEQRLYGNILLTKGVVPPPIDE